MHKRRAGKHLGGCKPRGNDRRGNCTQKLIETMIQGRWTERATVWVSPLETWLNGSVTNRRVKPRYPPVSISHQWRRGVSSWSPFSSPDRGWAGAGAAGPSLLGATRSGRRRSSLNTGRSSHCGRVCRDVELLYCVSEQSPLWAWTWRQN